ncbi:MAG TPA: class I SAM-dependent methyltransferase, partial [Streptosporangiaceae bacterium]|nr:class I SAM-dependent methyltransferase [Streptosporangiaceae bacterium]
MTGAADPDVQLSALDALLSGPGAELLASLRHQSLTPGTALALGTRLRETYPAGLVAAALAQHELRLAARAKFSRAMDMFFTRAGLEQASAEVVAQHRQARFAEAAVLADLCCGIGGDLVALAGKHQVRAVDRDALHLRMAMLNAEACGVGGYVQAVQADVRKVDLAGMDAAFIDPARRTGGRRLGPGASEPSLAWCLDLAGRVPRMGIKTAPGIARDSVPGGHTLTPHPGPPVPVAA